MEHRLAEGKVPWDLIADRLAAALPPEVVLGPAVGEDAALVRMGEELWAVASDPVTFSAADVGRLAVVVNANDVAARGARPLFFLAVLLLAPEDAAGDRVRAILDDILTSCRRLGVALIGGHSEVTPGLSHSMVVGTMLGRVEGRALTTGGLREGDWVGMTKWAGLEGTAILLSQMGDRLRERHGPGAFREAEDILAGDWLSVVEEARVAAGHGEVTALHDVTEGGVGEAVYEMGRASGLAIEVRREDVPVLEATRCIASDLSLDPLGLIGSGSLLIGCSDAGREALGEELAAHGIQLTWIGRARAVAAGRGALPRFERDEILRAFRVRGIRGVVFDMDGTLVDSRYDWPEIRRRLGIDGASIIDELNGLPPDQSRAGWEEMERIEAEATRSARLHEGVPELLSLLRARGLPTALVTNNTDDNAGTLLERFGLVFDVVLTRDSGLWKPSGAPFRAAMERLGATPGECLVVGDSRHDLDAARAAGCARVCLLYGGAARHADEADLAFADVPALTRYLDLVL